MLVLLNVLDLLGRTSRRRLLRIAMLRNRAGWVDRGMGHSPNLDVLFTILIEPLPVRDALRVHKRSAVESQRVRARRRVRPAVRNGARARPRLRPHLQLVLA